MKEEATRLPTQDPSTAASGSAGVEISFTLTPGEYAEGYRALLLRSMWLRVALILLALFSVFELLASPQRLDAFISRLAFLALLWGVTLYWLFIQPRVRHKRQVRASGPQRHEFSDDGIVSDVREADIRQGWAYFTETRESEHLYLMFTDHSSVNMIPKRALDVDQERVFRGLVERHSKAHLRNRLCCQRRDSLSERFAGWSSPLRRHSASVNPAQIRKATAGLYRRGDPPC